MVFTNGVYDTGCGSRNQEAMVRQLSRHRTRPIEVTASTLRLIGERSVSRHLYATEGSHVTNPGHVTIMARPINCKTMNGTTPR